MKSIEQVLRSSPVSAYTGSEITKSMVEDAIKLKYGPAELKNLDCYHNCRSFSSWLKLGWRVRKGEKAIRSFTIVETRDSDGSVIKRIKRPCYLFYMRQVEKISDTKSYEENNDN